MSIGRFSWVELLARDPDKVPGFYQRTIGWKLQAWDNDPSYRMWMNSVGMPIGGLMKMPPDVPPDAKSHWLSYVTVANVDDTVRKVLSLGGMAFVAGLDVPGAGRIAVLADPQGAEFGLHQALPDTPQFTPHVVPGSMAWFELASTDWRASAEFYGAIFGWVKHSEFDMGPGGNYFMFSLPGDPKPMGGMYNKPPEMQGPPSWLPYAEVTDVRKTAKAAAGAGGSVIVAPMEVPGGGWIATFIDPIGAVIAIHQAPAEPASKPAAKPKKKAAKKAAKKTAAKPKKKAAAKKKGPTKKKPAAKKAVKKKVARKVVKKKAAKKKAVKKRK